MSVLHNVELHYPSARFWIWDYCVYLGSYTDSGKHYDLGVYVQYDGSLSAAVVFGNEPGNYISGEESLPHKNPVVLETFRRAHSIGL